MADLPCRNENCKSFGHPHPNCRCYGGMAKGGSVESFCSQDRMHHSGCEYYAEGGPVAAAPQEDPAATLGNAAVEHGLLGLLKNVGHPNMVEPEKHSRILHEARNQHEWRRDPKEMKLPRTHGTRLGDHLADGDHEKAAEHMHGHPLVGNATKGHLKEMMGQLSGPMMTQEPHPEGFRGAVDYLSSAHKGSAKLDHYMKSLLGSGKTEKLPVPSTADLQSHLQALEENPSALLEVGGSLGHYLPGQSVQLSSTAAQAVNYLKSLKPTQSQSAPLDKISSVSRADQEKYDRQLSIAQQPLLALAHLKTGTLVPQDLMTIQTVYPGLHKEMVSKATEALVDKMAKNESLPYHQKMGLSLFLGQPLDSTMTPISMQAILQANGAQQAPQTGSGMPKKASGVELKQLNKVDSLYGTATDKRQMDGK